ncbi:MAG: ABC transporter [Spirochaeta sp.]|nr:ABC transporter [Spirochaeta sp.]RPG05502.1 MAG: AarF/ABC1/UbiB kinase family protein [Proteobacteria bacterium TMED72]
MTSGVGQEMAHIAKVDEGDPSEDSERWAFGEEGPWRLRLESIGWLNGLDAVREEHRRELPLLTQARLWPPLGRFVEAARAVGGALLIWRVREGRHGGETSRQGLSLRLRRAFEGLGSAYIKLAQIISSGRGLFPEELVDEFKHCLDQVPPDSFEDVRRTVEEEIGGPLDSVFEFFDPKCLAAASIAQVHAARLKTGEDVVVKVQRANVDRLVRSDIAAMAWVAPKLVGRIPIAALANPPALVELFAETVLEELDFRLEAENMLDIARVLKLDGQTGLVVPRPHPELVTRRILVMERLSGFSYDDIEGMEEAGIETQEVLRAMLIGFLEGAMIYGVFHGDLHGGNLFVMEDGRVALLDYGMTGRLSQKQRSAFLKMMMSGAVSNMRGQLEAFRDLGALDPDADLDELMTLLKLDQAPRDPTKMSGEEIAGEIQEILKALMGEGARLPKPLMLYAKDMLFFDGAVNQLAPELDMLAEFTRIYGYFAQNHAETIVSQIGFDPSATEVDLSIAKATLGLEEGEDSITHRELQERRLIVQQKLEEQALHVPSLGLGGKRDSE